MASNSSIAPHLTRNPSTDSVALPPSMKAWRVHQFGPAEAMILETVPRPDPGPGELLVEVHAAGVGPWDARIRGGMSALPQPLPLTLGSDISGKVVAVGSGTSGLSVGHEVYGVTNNQFVGGYAEYAVASAGMLAMKPASLSYVAAASVPVVAVTAWQALFDQARLHAGQTVLIHGAAGNVGSYAVQLAHRARLRCVATAQINDSDYLRSLGVDEVIDYRHQRFEDEVRSADAVIDLVGGATQLRSYRVLRSGGKLISTVSLPDQNRARMFGIVAKFFLVDVTGAGLRQIAELIDRGELRPHVGEVLPLSEAREAHFGLDGRRPVTKGKTVLRVRDDG